MPGHHSRALKNLLPFQKLVPNNKLFERAIPSLHECFFPEKIAVKLRAMETNCEDTDACRNLTTTPAMQVRTCRSLVSKR